MLIIRVLGQHGALGIGNGALGIGNWELGMALVLSICVAFHGEAIGAASRREVLDIRRMALRKAETSLLAGCGRCGRTGKKS
ncbi:hypothetical protein, partial [Nostoc sp. UIC 10630]|uniref:hypothetical protein n=1 Tax=Nostoc sp. UIC 10630 TaxID=2100146 RepID=UPI0013D687E0